MDNVNEMDIVQSASTMNRLRYQATGLKWEREAEGGATSEFDTTVGTELNDLKVKIQYQQDMHGYDHPWPAGGGKNQFNINAVENKSITNNSIVNDNGIITVTIGESSPYNGISTDKTLAQLAPGIEAGETYVLTVETTGTAQIYLTDVKWESGTSKTLTAEEIAKSVWLYAAGKGTEATITAIQIEKGTTATDLEPYENECPITGYDEAEIYLEPEYDAEADPRYTIDLDGTRYSGTIDITTGEMVLDKEILDTQSNYWDLQSINSYGIANFRYYKETPYKYDFSDRGICNIFPYQTTSIGNTQTEGYTVITAGGTLYVRLREDNASTLAQFKEWASSNNLQILLKLAEPITVQLDPTTVTALTGHNVIWCNTGNIISVDYNIT